MNLFVIVVVLWRLRSQSVSPVQLGIHCITHAVLPLVSLLGAGSIGVRYHA